MVVLAVSRHLFYLGSIRYFKNYQNLIKVSSNISMLHLDSQKFVSLKPHFNTQWRVWGGQGVQLTLFRPWGTDSAHPLLLAPPKFLNFPASLWWASHYYPAGNECKKAKAWQSRGTSASEAVEVSTAGGKVSSCSKDLHATFVCVNDKPPPALLLPYKV